MSRALSPPTRLIGAEKIDSRQLPIALHDHAPDRAPDSARDDALAELALAAAVVAWRSRWQPVTIHAALWAGATVTNVAAVTGPGNVEVVRLWTQRTNAQTHLVIAGRRSVDPDEVRTIHQRIREEVYP